MYLKSSIADDIRVPLQINVVCLVLLQPRRRTPHRSCSNDGNVHHSGAVPSTPFTEASDLLPRLRKSHQHHHPPRPTQWCWGPQGYAKEVVHSSLHFVTLHSCRSLGYPFLWNYYGTTIRAFGYKEWSKARLEDFFLWCLFQRKNIGILISTWMSFSN